MEPPMSLSLNNYTQSFSRLLTIFGFWRCNGTGVIKAVARAL